MHAASTGRVTSRALLISALSVTYTDLIDRAKWPSKFNWEGYAHVGKWFFDRLTRWNIRRRRCEMRPLPRPRMPKMKMKFSVDRPQVCMCANEKVEGVSGIQRSQVGERGEGLEGGGGKRLGSGAKRVPRRRSNLFQFTFILNRELGCNQSPLFTRFLDTFVSFHLRHGTPSPPSAVRSSTPSYFHLFKLLNPAQNWVQPLSILFRPGNIVVRHSCSRNTTSSLAVDTLHRDAFVRDAFNNTAEMFLRKEIAHPMKERGECTTYIRAPNCWLIINNIIYLLSIIWHFQFTRHCHAMTIIFINLQTLFGTFDRKHSRARELFRCAAGNLRTKIMHTIRNNAVFLEQTFALLNKISIERSQRLTTRRSHPWR